MYIIQFVTVITDHQLLQLKQALNWWEIKWNNKYTLYGVTMQCLTKTQSNSHEQHYLDTDNYVN